MSVNSPGEINSYYNEVFRSGNLERLVALYEPDAVLEAQPGELVRGRSAIREQLNNLLALKGELHAENQSYVEFGDLALLRADWQFTGEDPSGKPVSMGSASSKVARRQPDGTWLYIIDLPFGSNPKKA